MKKVKIVAIILAIILLCAMVIVLIIDISNASAYAKDIGSDIYNPAYIYSSSQAQFIPIFNATYIVGDGTVYVVEEERVTNELPSTLRNTLLQLYYLSGVYQLDVKTPAGEVVFAEGPRNQNTFPIITAKNLETGATDTINIKNFYLTVSPLDNETFSTSNVIYSLKTEINYYTPTIKNIKCTLYLASATVVTDTNFYPTFELIPTGSIELYYELDIPYELIAVNGWQSRVDELQTAFMIYANAIRITAENSYQEGYSQGELIGKQEGIEQGYTSGYEEGYDSGNAAGIQTGKQEGYREGYLYGYDQGYLAGQQSTGQNNVGFETATATARTLFESVFQAFEDVKLFGIISINSLIIMVVVIGIFLFILKLIRG